jgi:hypothetical protein
MLRTNHDAWEFDESPYISTGYVRTSRRPPRVRPTRFFINVVFSDMVGTDGLRCSPGFLRLAGRVFPGGVGQLDVQAR